MCVYLTCLVALVNLIAVEAPATGVACTGEAFEFLYTTFGIVATDYSLQIIAN